MSTKHLHLVRRGAIYYWRRRLPSDVGAILKRTHYVRSLRTAEPTRARLRARRITLVGDELFLRISHLRMTKARTPDKADLDRILADLFSEIIDGGEANRLHRPIGDWPWMIELDWDDEDQEIAAQQQPEDTANVLRAHMQMNDFSIAQAAVEQKLRKRGLAVPADTLKYRGFLRKALATMAAAHAIDAQRERGIYEPVQHPFLDSRTGPDDASYREGEESDLELLSAAFENYCAERKRMGQWRAETDRDANEALRLFLELRGDMPFAQVTRSDAVDFKEKLSLLPRMRGKVNSIYQGKSAVECIEIRKKLEKAAGKKDAQDVTVAGVTVTKDRLDDYVQTIGPKTINKHLTALRAFFTWKTDSGLQPGRNPFDGLSYKKSEVRKAMNKRDLWNPEDLANLFQTPVWTGSASRVQRATPGENIYEDGRYWIPLLGVYTGMRQEEICVLPVTSLRTWQKGDIVCIHTEGTKSESADRLVPVHDDLKKMGFLDYVARMRDTGEKMLFPELGTGKEAAITFGKWFTRYRQTVGLYQKGMDFHSFRHTFKTQLHRKYKHNNLIVDCILGHKISGMDDVYFHGYTEEDLNEAIQSVDYGIDLSHLYRSALAAE